MPPFSLYYITAGRSDLPPLLLLHGFLGSALDFEVLLPALSQQFYCLVPDLPGHGQSFADPSQYTFAETARSLLHLLDTLKIPQTHLLGYSMGGRLALYLTCQFPEHFARTVLESASPGLKTATERAQRRQQDEAIARQLETIPLNTFLTQWYDNPLFASLKDVPATRAAMLQRRQNNKPHELARALRGLSTGRQPSLWNRLTEIDRPLLLLAGDRDPKYVRINRDIFSCLKLHETTQATLKIFPNCGHNIHLEAPQQYLQAIAQFLG